MPSISSLLLAALAAAPLFSMAVPLRKARDAAAGDLLVLNFASVLERLETEFYTQALAKFQDADFQTAGYSSSLLPTQQFQNIMNIYCRPGGQVISGCTFSFSSVLTDVNTMAATARVVENVGVSAYLGAAHLISDPRVLEAAGSILTIEARHQTVLNVLSGTGTAIPQGFDMAMSPSEVLAIAGSFISGCETGIPSNTALTLTNTGTPSAGTLLTFSWSGMPSDTSGLSCQMMIGGAVNSISLPLSGCNVPATVNGPVAIWITNSTQPLLNNVIDRSTAQTVAGPTLAFIDAKPEAMGELIRGGSASSSSATTSISPAQASSIASADPSTATSATSGPNLSTGPGADGVVTVNGWTNLPPGV
ncbi:ferritin-like domain-containing protein [Gautieria morchelliformis]|nr:ferritin-like domain-containing protein [Gautieria morchelliformis]